MKIGVTIVIST